MAINNVVNKLAKVAVLAVGVTAVVYLTPIIAPLSYYTSTTQPAIATTGGTGLG